MKIIRNIDGKKLELTLTNEEAMSVFMDVFFDTDKFADCPANGLFGRGDGIFAERCKQDISSALDCEGTRKPSDLVLQYLGKQMQDTLNCEYEHLPDDIAERYTNILHWAERHDEATIQANIKAVQRRYVEGESLFTMRHGKIAQGQDMNDEDYFEDSFFVTVLESLLTEHPEIIGTKLDA